ncbi:MAG: RNA polymerase sigma factor, partial [Pseudoalteromonas sp.]
MTKKVKFTSTFVDISKQLKRFVSRIVQPDDVE